MALPDRRSLPARLPSEPHIISILSFLSARVTGKAPLQCSRQSCILTQNARIHKMYQAEILKEIILDGSPRDKHPPAGFQAVQSLVSLIIRVLQPVSLQGNSHLGLGTTWHP